MQRAEYGLGPVEKRKEKAGLNRAVSNRTFSNNNWPNGLRRYRKNRSEQVGLRSGARARDAHSGGGRKDPPVVCGPGTEGRAVKARPTDLHGRRCAE